MSLEIASAWATIIAILVWVATSATLYVTRRRTFMGGFIPAVMDGLGFTLFLGLLGFVGVLFLGAVFTVLNP